MGKEQVVGINILIQNGKSMMGFSHKCMHAEAHWYTEANRTAAFGVLVACYITVMDDNDGDSMATLDFPDMSSA